MPRWWRWASIRDTELSIPLHLRVLHGRDHHHITEAQYKALARALRAAVEPDPRLGGIPSTKGAL